MLTINRVIYNPPATIILWNDGTKTMSKCDKEDEYKKEVGFMLCVLKKKYGNKTVKKMFDKYVYNTSTPNAKGSIVVNEKPTKPSFRKPNVNKSRVKVNRPTQWIRYREANDLDDIMDILIEMLEGGDLINAI